MEEENKKISKKINSIEWQIMFILLFILYLSLSSIRDGRKIKKLQQKIDSINIVQDTIIIHDTITYDR